ncbi:unnamed protein product [Owenia fusiformis]|uniref:J domain-containing protein n=1 Tax=Owenia fusiformis TaxID=6347 RepID=A0A8S4N428_OWEFU|nr:unnamed protein product [Owenia fusiformis]
MAAASERNGEVEYENLYAVLGIDDKASIDDVERAYKKYSRLYHPDKHLDPKSKKSAETLFNKVSEARDILADPQKKYVYDTLGRQAVDEMESWVVPRNKRPEEMYQEYERMKKEEEERRLQQKTNPKGSINVGIDATDLFDRYDEQFFSGLPTIEISQMSISQSIEAPLTLTDTATLGGTLSASNGVGAGNVSASFRRMTSHNGWGEVEVAAGNGASFSMRGFRTLWSRGYGTMAGTFQFTPHGIRPGLTTVLAQQLDKNIHGRLTWNVGLMSSMNTTVTWDNQVHHLAVIMQLGIPTCYVALNYFRRFQEEEAKLRLSLKAGTFGALLEYGVEKKISQFSILGATIIVGSPVGVTLKIKLNRGNQVYLFPIHLSEQIIPSALFYGSVIPVLTYFAVKQLLVKPFLKEQKDKELKEQKQENRERLQKKKEEAREAILLMKNKIESIKQAEKLLGLIILAAKYGKIYTSEESRHLNEECCIDVTDPLYVLIDNHKLIVPGGVSKSGLEGFFDPCYGEEKQLYVKYMFREQIHEVIVGDKEKLRIPLAAHLLDQSNIPNNTDNAR